MIYLIFWPKQVYSQEKTSIDIAPAIIESSNNPGDAFFRTLTIKNSGLKPLPVSIKTQSYLDSDNIKIREKKYNASSWIKLEKDSYLLAPDQIEKLQVNIEIPKNASPGGHYAQIAIRGLTLEQNDVKSSIVVPELIVGVFITVSGDIDENFELLSWDVGSVHNTPNNKLTSVIKLINTGNVHNLITPKLSVYKEDQLVEEYFFQPKTVLPGGKEEFTLEWKSPEDFGIYNQEIEVQFGTPTVSLLKDTKILFISPSLINLLAIAVFVWISLYMFQHKRNIKAAFRALKQGA